MTAANAEAVKAEKQKIQEAEMSIKTETVAKLLKRGKLTIEEIAEDSSINIEFVLEIQRGLAKNL
ncbi:hypothetical protein [Spirosoma endbachense]|uniref:hypothetical protein n=1 Tax=Spirosoma endbachense TaxID=2666025 RepID=UPI00293BF622|nr:hypothetical protein [Spirosoma endbachense]